MEIDDATARRFARTVSGMFGLVFLVGVLAGIVRGSVLFALFFGVFAVGAFTMRWLIGKGIWDWT